MLTAATTTCQVCNKPAFPHTTAAAAPLVLGYLCRHLVHAACAVMTEDVELPERPENAEVTHLLLSDRPSGSGTRNAQQRALGGKLGFAAMVRVRVGSCPVCRLQRGDARDMGVSANAASGRIAIAA